MPELGEKNEVMEKHKEHGPNVNCHESRPTIFTNGHHKPVHKFNDAHNHCGAPYFIRRAQSHQSHREIAQRSADTLPAHNTPTSHHDPSLQSPINTAQPQRKTRSEHDSPTLAASTFTAPASAAPPYSVTVPPLAADAYSYSPFESQTSPLRTNSLLPDKIPEHWFTTYDHANEFGPPSHNETLNIDWSKYGFGHDIDPVSPTCNSNSHATGSTMLSNPNLTEALRNNPIPSYTHSLDYINHKDPNTSSSNLSDVDQAVHRPQASRTISHTSLDMPSSHEDTESHRVSTGSSHFSAPYLNTLSGDFDDLDIDRFIEIEKRKRLNGHSYTYASHSQQQQYTPPESDRVDKEYADPIRAYSVTTNPSGVEHSFSISEAQQLAHPAHIMLPEESLASQQYDENHRYPGEALSIRSSQTAFVDPMWSEAQTMEKFLADDSIEDEQWAR